MSPIFFIPDSISNYPKNYTWRGKDAILNYLQNPLKDLLDLPHIWRWQWLWGHTPSERDTDSVAKSTPTQRSETERVTDRMCAVWTGWQSGETLFFYSYPAPCLGMITQRV